jgi:cytochrome c-type biogenesis protein CcmE
LNKRARQRLVGVTVLILVVVGALVLFVMTQGGAYKKSVADVVSDPSLVGKQVQVQGEVVAGSWTPNAKPLTFSIRQMEDPNGPTVKVVWGGPVPSAFGDGTVAIVTGIVGQDQTVEAKQLITQCPSKYESAKDALTVDKLLSGKLERTPVKITGYVVEGSVKPSGTEPRFTLGTTSKGGETVEVSWSGAMPQGATSGAKMVVSGELIDGVFVATDVAVDEKEK